MKHFILIVETDSSKIEYWKRIQYLREYIILFVENENEVMSYVEKVKFSLIILNSNLIETNTHEIIQMINVHYDVLFAFIVKKNDFKAMASCFKIGDEILDYEMTCFEISGRIKMLLKRSLIQISNLTIGNLTIDSIRNIVEIHGEPIFLTQIEFMIFRMLAISLDVFVDYATLNRISKGYSQKENDQVLMTHISNIRKKLNSIKYSQLGIEVKKKRVTDYLSMQISQNKYLLN